MPPQKSVRKRVESLSDSFIVENAGPISKPPPMRCAKLAEMPKNIRTNMIRCFFFIILFDGYQSTIDFSAAKIIRNRQTGKKIKRNRYVDGLGF